MFMTMEHLGGGTSEKDAAAYQELRKTRRPGLLAMAKKMKLTVKSEHIPPSHKDLLEANARKKGLLSG